MECHLKVLLRSSVLALILFVILFWSCGSVLGMGLDFGTPEPSPVIEPVITPGPLGAPVRLDSYSETTLIVSDYSSGTVFLVNKDDPSVVRSILTLEGRALAIGHFGKNIVVGNATTGNVEVYNNNGKLQYILNRDERIERPSDIEIDKRMKRIFVVDSRGREIKMYTSQGLLNSFGSDDLVNPVGIALNPSVELVYVSDHGDSTIGVPPAVHIFTYDGVKIGKLDSETFEFYRPRGLAFNLGKLYITDALAGVVIVVDVDSMAKLGILGEYGSDPGQLVQPQDVHIDQGGQDVYVANKRLGRIEKINTGGALQ